MRLDLSKCTSAEDIARAMEPIHEAIDAARAEGVPVFLHIAVAWGTDAEKLVELPSTLGFSRGACRAMARYWEQAAERAEK